LIVDPGPLPPGDITLSLTLSPSPFLGLGFDMEDGKKRYNFEVDPDPSFLIFNRNLLRTLDLGLL
jgi:hypothetical protein